MTVDVVLLPEHLKPEHVRERVVVVFDVLRATTSIAAALSAGARSIRIFGSIEQVQQAATASGEVCLLCGERECLPPEGFDLGNSPGGFTAAVCEGKSLLFSTTNGTRAILASEGAAQIVAGALLNAAAVARWLRAQKSPVTLLCAGTNGAIAMEDVLGAGAVMSELAATGPLHLETDVALMALTLFHSIRDDLPRVLRQTRGGLNVIAAGLEADIDFAARLNVLDVVPLVKGGPPTISLA